MGTAKKGQWIDETKPLCNRLALEAFSSWKTLAWQKHNGAVTSPSIEAACGAERHFRMLVVRADHSRNVGACWSAEFLCVEAPRPASRERCGHLVLLSSSA